MDNIDNEIKTLKARVKKLEALKQEFPDLMEKCTRWDKLLCSLKVCEQPENFSVTASCGCCEDAVLQVNFYLERDGTRIYAPFLDIAIGEKRPYPNLYHFYDDWKDNVENLISKKAADMLQIWIDEQTNENEDGE